MAVVLHYVPQVSTVAVVRVNLLLAALLLAYATWDLGRDRDAADFTGFPLQREALTAPNVVAMVVLMAWSVTLATSPFSGTTLALQGRFGIPATRFLRWNFRSTLVGLATRSALLALAGGYGWI